ncbi:lysylphosphatidylglycerol synthase transmembrane domain-containing protein [Pseudohongiella sp.]|uniref:TIGR00374 family protein n=1 Tax=marine sediment metagenome TaxID=412755 RepID=A0A0F9W2R8_9ZZZZ|nr:lysylphosphatidylglycerol synthase transmembrane domain-containing protein [Pseudohongiella sp.]HDZ09206.1 flippase-like domain-containing protein [Pseudohongiella sp.]HEA63366.1 flippase-like domain-containing protein [Pseudohongiella sp.]
MPQSRWIALLLWPVALVLVTWTLSQMPLAGIGDTLGKLSWQQWLVWTLVNLLVIMVSTERWRRLGCMLGKAPGFLQMLLIRQAGQTVSFITPAPHFGGEPFQIYWLYKRAGMAVHRAVLSLALDRFYELWINFMMLLLGVSLLLLAPQSGMQAGSQNSDWQMILLLMMTLLAVLSAIAWLLVRQPALLSARLEKAGARWLSSPRLKTLGEHWHLMGSDLKAVVRSQKPALLTALVLSLLGWALMIFEVWLVLAFFDIRLNAVELALILVAMRLALLLPLPGGIGTLEAAVFWTFQSLALPVESALGLIALMRLRDVVVLLSGLLCLRALQTARPAPTQPA